MNISYKRKFIINFTYFSLWLFIGFFITKVAFAYLLPFVIGVLIAYAVQRPSRYLSNKFNIKKETSAAVLSVIVFIILSFLIFALCFYFSLQISRLAKNFLEYSGDINAVFESFYNNIDRLLKNIDSGFQPTVKKFSADAINGVIEKVGLYLSNGITGIIKKLPNIVFSCLVTVVATCYISKDFDKIVLFVKGIISDKIYHRLIGIKTIFTECVSKFFIGYLWIFIITFLELSIGLLLIGVKNFFVLAIFISLLDTMPIIGTGTVLLPWAAISFLKNNFGIGVGLVVLYLIIVVVRNFIEPKIIGKQIGINPLFTLVFMFFGLRFAGVAGMIISPIIFTVFFTYYRRCFLESD